MFWNRVKKIIKKDDLANDEGLSADDNITRIVTKKIPIDFLKTLVPINDLSDDELQKLELGVSSHAPGDVIFKINGKSNSIPYLIKGQCYVESSNGSGQLMNSSTFKALYPLTNGRKLQCTVIAKSEVKILHFPANVLNLSSQRIRNPLLNSQDIPDKLVNNAFFNEFCSYFKQDKLVIPCLPDVALKLRTAIQKDIGIQEAVQIINFDSVISSRLIQIVNSPLYRAVNPITNSLDAVSRLGLDTTRNLVTSISIQNLFKSKNKEINLKIHELWKKSIEVSSISYTLAVLTKKVNPDEALLAGLTHNIGALPILIFADSLSSDEYSEQDLNLTITALQGLIGSLILKTWGFSDTLQVVPQNVQKWYGNEQGELDMSDIVLLAKYHSYIGSKSAQKLPAIYTLPAFQKLGNNELTPDMSLQTLNDAKQQIAEAMSLFRG